MAALRAGLTTTTPLETLHNLLDASDGPPREVAWTAFLEEHSDLILYVARRLGGDHDAVMDRYAFVLEALQRDGFQRLRAYTDEGRGSFATWLIVVSRRLCLDQHRHRYGRPQGEGPEAQERHAERRNLVDLVGDELALAEAPGADDGQPDHLLLRNELRRVLTAALDRLDVPERLILRLRFEDGLSVPEIARLLGAGSPFKLYRQIDRLLASLRSSLERIGVEDSVP